MQKVMAPMVIIIIPINDTVHIQNPEGGRRLLPAEDFFQIHNSYLVNLTYVQKYIRGEGGEVSMLNGELIPVSRSKK